MKKAPERSKYVYNPQDMKDAMEKRAEYLSQHYMRTGVLLQF
jgi:hypothetical protein